ncbi:hypothetical protein HDU96_004074 [Phlyctochytrium bullatum]|nr:hypothetical protein HDU96_004074 [Phlyctochytrium bullatum]
MVRAEMPAYKSYRNNNISIMVQPIVHMNDSTANSIVSALSEIHACWPEIKVALEAFLNHKAAYDVLESQMSKYLAAIADLPETAKRLEALKISRGAFDLAKSRYPNYKKAEALCVEVLEESKHTRDRLMEEYSGEGFERCSVEGAQAATHLFYNIDAHVDMKAQKEAISSSNIDIAAQKSNKIFELCPELPPHTIEP